MVSPTVKRSLIILFVTIIVFMLLFSFGAQDKKKKTLRPDIMKEILRNNSMIVAEKINATHKNIPFVSASGKMAANLNTKTAICETDETIGQQVLCKLQDQDDEKHEREKTCDSDYLDYYQNFTDLVEREQLNKDFTGWKFLFPRRDPIERFVDHFVDVCVRESRNCFDCRMNMKCYLNKIYDFIRESSEDIETMTEDQKKYIPQNWNCEMESMVHHFTFVEYKKFGIPSNPEFADSKRPDYWLSWGLFEDPITSYEIVTKYYTSFVYSRPDVLDLMKKIYYWDYVLLKIPFPNLKSA